MIEPIKFGEQQNKCVVHGSDDHPVPFEEDCEYCQAEHTEWMQRIMQIDGQNRKTLEQLATQGAQVNLSDLRLNMIIDFVLSGNGRARLAFEEGFVRQVETALRDIQKQVNQQKLMQGVQPIENLRNVKPFPGRG